MWMCLQACDYKGRVYHRLGKDGMGMMESQGMEDLQHLENYLGAGIKLNVLERGQLATL